MSPGITPSPFVLSVALATLLQNVSENLTVTKWGDNMKALMILLITASFSMSAGALPPPHAVCRSAHPSNTSFVIDVVKNGDTYVGRLSEGKVSEETTRFEGSAFFTSKMASGCEIDVTNIDERCDLEWCLGPESFLLEIRPNGSHLYSVGDKAFNSVEGAMTCEYSDAFTADMKTLCDQ